MRIAELMTREVTNVEPEATFRELASLLATEHIGGVPVVRGEEVVGAVSAAAYFAGFWEDAGADVHPALVTEDNRLLGMVTTLDIMRAVAERGLAGPVVPNRS